MKNQEIRNRLKNAVNEAPIELLESIQQTTIRKMDQHDSITEQKEKSRYVNMMRPMAVAMSFMLVIVIGLMGWYQLYQVPNSYLYLDVNPGIEIVMNRQEQVIDLIGINTEGESLVKAVDYKGQSIENVEGQIIEQIVKQGYVNDSRRVMLVSGFHKDQEKSKKMIEEFDQRIHDYFKDYDIKPLVLRQVLDRSNTLEEFSETYNISLGKLAFIQNLMILNSELELEELIDLGIEELLVLSLETGLNLDESIDTEDDYEKFRLPASDDIPVTESIVSDDDDVNDGDEDDADDRDDVNGENDEDRDEEDEDDDETSDMSQEIIGRERAIEIAKNRVGGGEVESFEYDQDDQKYEIELQYQGYEYEIEINAITGAIISFEQDEDFDDDMDDEDDDDDRDDNEDDETSDMSPELIGREQAIEIAIDRVGGGEVQEFEYDQDDQKYEIELQYQGYEYEIEMNAITGEIISFEQDEDFDDDVDEEDDDDDRDDNDNDNHETSEMSPELIGRERAIEIAKDRVGGGEVESFEYDQDDQEYEIKLRYQGYEYEIEMNAITGAIISFDEDDDLDEDDEDE